MEVKITGVGYGYVYVMSYPGSDKVKIGHSHNPPKRAAEIGGTLAPEQPIIELLFWCAERREDVERAAHKIANSRRHNGEWFCLSPNETVGIIKQAAASAGVEVQVTFDKAKHEELEKCELIFYRAKLETMTDAELYREERTAVGARAAAVAKELDVRQEKRNAEFRAAEEANRVKNMAVLKELQARAAVAAKRAEEETQAKAVKPKTLWNTVKEELSLFGWAVANGWRN